MKRSCLLLIGFFMIVPLVHGAGGRKPVPQPEVWKVSIDGSNISGEFSPSNTGVVTNAVYTPPSSSCSDRCSGSSFSVNLTESEAKLYFGGFEMEDAEIHNQVRCNFYDSITEESPDCLAAILNREPYPTMDYQWARLRVSLYGIDFKNMEVEESIEYKLGEGDAINRARILLNVARTIYDCTFKYSSVGTEAIDSVKGGTILITHPDINTWMISVQGVSINLLELGYAPIETRKGPSCKFYIDSDPVNGIWTKPVSFEMTFTLQ